jgi:predicted nucleic acid-binding protein
MFSSSFTMSQQEHRQWTPYKHGWCLRTELVEIIGKRPLPNFVNCAAGSSLGAALFVASSMRVALTRFVLDASVTLCWLFADQATVYTESVLDRLAAGDSVLAPMIWPFEIANVVTISERRKLVNPAQAAAFFRTLGQLSIVLDHAGMGPMFSAVVETARRYRLSAFDADYLELAIREALPLATVDVALGRAARAAGVRLA